MSVLCVVSQRQPDRQCTNNVALRSVHESIVAVEKKSIIHWSVCAALHVRACMWVPRRVGVCLHIRAYSLANPACNAYGPYCDVICDSSVSTTFFDILS